MPMDVELSDEALAEYDRLEASDPAMFELLRDDLALLAVHSIDDLDRWATLLSLGYYQGPSGRARYWAVVERGRFVIEFFDIDA